MVSKAHLDVIHKYQIHIINFSIKSNMEKKMITLKAIA